MKVLYITQIEMKLFEVSEVTQNWTKMFNLPKFEWSYYHLARDDEVCGNLVPPKFFQIMEIFLTSAKFERSCRNLLKFHWNC